MNFVIHLHHHQLVDTSIYNFGCLIDIYYYHIVPKKIILIVFFNIEVIII